MAEKETIQDILPAYFEGSLDAESKKKVERWKAKNDENLTVFIESQQVWEKMELLQRMQKYNAEEALKNVHKTIEKNKARRFFKAFQRIAAILIVPLLLATLYFSLQNKSDSYAENNWHTLKTGAGMRSEFTLPDGTTVYMNSNTTLSYPVSFTGKIRDVRVEGEAFFEVADNKSKPFIVCTGDVNVEVTGTQFTVSNYSNEEITEIVLVEGAVNLFEGNYLGKKKELKTLVPGEKATYYDKDKTLYFEMVDVEKYLAWKHGKLMFRDDSMKEVVRRLNRWYNVDIKLSGRDLGDYVYTATFEDESLIQVLDLLKISAPIEYRIEGRKQKEDTTFRKMKIEIIQQ